MARMNPVKLRKFDPKTTKLEARVQVTAGFKLRTWIALKLFAAGAWVIGCGFEIQEAGLKTRTVTNGKSNHSRSKRNN